MAIGAGLLAMTRFELAWWLMAVFALVLWDLCARGTDRAQGGAVLTLALLPFLYGIGLWLLMNWLIMGDALYCLRSCFVGIGRCSVQNGAVDSVSPAGMHYAAALVSLCALLVALGRRNRAGVFLSLLAVVPLMLALYEESRNRLWQPAPALLVLFPTCLLALGYMAGSRMKAGPWTKALAAIGAVVSTLAVAFCPTGVPRMPSVDGAFGGAVAARHEWLPRIERHVLSKSRFATVFVCGYDSFALLGVEADPLFVHALDFNFHKAREDYPGRTLYMLVHRPAGRSATDSVHWKFDRLYTLGTRQTLYDGDWGEWRLFEIIQAPVP